MTSADFHRSRLVFHFRAHRSTAGYTALACVWSTLGRRTMQIGSRHRRPHTIIYHVSLHMCVSLRGGSQPNLGTCNIRGEKKGSSPLKTCRLRAPTQPCQLAHRITGLSISRCPRILGGGATLLPSIPACCLLLRPYDLQGARTRASTAPQSCICQVRPSIVTNSLCRRWLKVNRRLDFWSDVA